MNPNEPLGLPRGSVRALLAIGVTLAAIVSTFVQGELSTELGVLAGAVITYYFTYRNTEPAAEAPLPEPFLEEPK